MSLARIMQSMYEAQFLIFCAGKSADTRGNISLHGIFDRLWLAEFPSRYTPFLAVAQIKAKKAAIKAKLNVSIVIERANKQISKQDVVLPVTVEKNFGFGFEIDFGGYVFEEPGDYYFKLYIDEKLLISRSLMVRPATELQPEP